MKFKKKVKNGWCREESIVFTELKTFLYKFMLYVCHMFMVLIKKNTKW